jgi:hypothetical protein
VAAADDPHVDVDLSDGPIHRGSQVDGDDGEELIDDLGHRSTVVEVRIDTDIEILTCAPDLDSQRLGPGPAHHSRGCVSDHVAQLGAPLSAVALEIGIARTHSRRQRSVSIQ